MNKRLFLSTLSAIVFHTISFSYSMSVCHRMVSPILRRIKFHSSPSVLFVFHSIETAASFTFNLWEQICMQLTLTPSSYLIRIYACLSVSLWRMPVRIAYSDHTTRMKQQKLVSRLHKSAAVSLAASKAYSNYRAFDAFELDARKETCNHTDVDQSLRSTQISLF